MIKEIKLLDECTIDKIAAGEVVERPLNVVKELVENAIDAGASAITVELKEGGISLIRVTDNGSGIDKPQLKKAFLRHATSKIRNADDLLEIQSLGFRGEALSSIASVSQVEVISKTQEEMIGSRLVLDGGIVQSMEDVGAPKGTTFIIKNLFFNVPARKKFLKKSSTEGSYIIELMEKLALSRPDISFNIIQNRKEKFHTYGNGNLNEVIYKIYGKDITKEVIALDYQENDIHIQGVIGKPCIARGNRNFQTFFINQRIIQSKLVSKALEEGFGNRLMNHQFPFAILEITIPPEKIDVNVHPTKLEVRFHEEDLFFSCLFNSVQNLLLQTQQIPKLQLDEERKTKDKQIQDVVVSYPEPFEEKRKQVYQVEEAGIEEKYSQTIEILQDFMQDDKIKGKKENEIKNQEIKKIENESSNAYNIEPPIEKMEQIGFNIEENVNKEGIGKYHILGQVFGTYWLIKTEEKLLLMDQHAAHEKVKYELLLNRIKNKTTCSQAIMPPIIFSFSTKEEMLLKEYWDTFLSLGFELEEFGGKEYALRGIPVDLYGCNEKTLLYKILDELEENREVKVFTVIEEKLASMSCKAAIKGSTTISHQEAEVLIEQLLTLENPYQCPHGRPVLIAMSKYELEKKFKRIL